MGRGKYMILDVHRQKNAAYYVVQLKVKKQKKRTRITIMKIKVFIDLWTEIKGCPFVTFLPPTNQAGPVPQPQCPKFCNCERNHPTYYEADSTSLEN